MNSSSIKVSFLHGDGLSRAGRQIARSVQKGNELAVLLVCLHDVERLCASIGHVATGHLLQEFHNRLRSIARDGDTVERIADRKFLVLLNGLRNQGHVTLAARKISRVARETGLRRSPQSVLEASIGVSLCPAHGSEGRELLRLAEVAALDGRRKGTPLCFYEVQSAGQLFRDWGMQARLDKALEAGDLELFYQPKCCLRSGRIVGAEALMRWNEPEIGAISPEVFIALAETTGQITDLTHFAIQNVCRQLGEWQDSLRPLNMAVNISPGIIQNSEVVDVIESATGIWGVAPGDLTLEVTENTLMDNRDVGHEVLTRVRELGAKVSIDDFGTGYSSFGYLKEIPADELKIDRSFVMGMLDDPGDRKIVEHTIRIAKSFGLGVVAEGVENSAVLEALRTLDCDYVQGYFICRPVPAGQFAAFLSGSSGAGVTANALSTEQS